MPNAKIDGTQIPINMAALVSPLKYSISEKISDIIEAAKNKISVVVNFLNMVLLILGW